MSRSLLLPLVVAACCGCSRNAAWDPTTEKGSFARIEGAVEDISAQLAPAKKKGAMRDLGSDSDRIGFALALFKKAAAGTPVEADAEDFEKKFIELEKLVGARAPMPKQQEALKQVQDSLATIKSKL